MLYGISLMLPLTFHEQDFKILMRHYYGVLKMKKQNIHSTIKQWNIWMVENKKKVFGIFEFVSDQKD